MLLVQKFDTITDISSEFIPGIEQLLMHELPNFDWALKHELGTPHKRGEEIFYYLFFAQNNNRPVGIATANIKECSLSEILQGPESLFFKLTGLGAKINVLFSNLFGLGISSYFDPPYQKEGEEQLAKIFKGLEERYHVDLAIFNQRLGQKNTITKLGPTPDTLFKTTTSLDSFFRDLAGAPPSLSMQEDIKIRDFKNFSSIYDAFRNDDHFKDFLTPFFNNETLQILHSSWSVLTYKKMFHGLILFVKGKNTDDLFCEVYTVKNVKNDYFPYLIQHILQRFFGLEKCQRLKLLNADHLNKEQKNLLDQYGIPLKNRPISLKANSFWMRPGLKLFAKN